MTAAFQRTGGRPLPSAATIREDFDRLAEFESGEHDGNAMFHDALLRHVPTPCALALDVGCGTGAFARRLAERAERVIGLDLSPRMVEVARARAGNDRRLEFRVADLTEMDLGEGRYDCVSAIASLHHLPLEPTLRRFAASLRPGGRLLVLDVVDESGPGGFVRAVISKLASETVLRGRRGNTRRAARAAWRIHERHDRLPKMSEVRAAVSRTLPGAALTHHLMWRWSLVWERPGAAR
jgi:SAM-dependent methyltransferase